MNASRPRLPSLMMRYTGSNATLIKAILEQTKIHTLEKLSQSTVKTAVVIDAMHLIRKLSFLPNENFSHVSDRYLVKGVPDGSEIIHFCCDRYRDVSLKSEARSKRAGKQRPETVYEINDTFHAPDPAHFFGVSQNKSRLPIYLCEKWYNNCRIDKLMMFCNLCILFIWRRGNILVHYDLNISPSTIILVLTQHKIIEYHSEYLEYTLYLSLDTIK